MLDCLGRMSKQIVIFTNKFTEIAIFFEVWYFGLIKKPKKIQLCVLEKGQDTRYYFSYKETVQMIMFIY